jgi:hypothetical protein
MTALVAAPAKLASAPRPRFVVSVPASCVAEALITP